MLGQITRQVGVKLEQRIDLHLLTDIIVIVAEEPNCREKFQRLSSPWRPRAELPDDRHPEAPIPTVLADIQRLVVVVLTDRQRQVGQEIDRESRFVAHGIGDVDLRWRSEKIDVEFEHRVAKAFCGLTDRTAGNRDIARGPSHGHDHRHHILRRHELFLDEGGFWG